VSTPPLPEPPAFPEPRDTLRERIARRDGCRCVYCGEHFRCEELTLDHVEPRMRGGDQSEGNLVAACQTCNTQKGSAPAWAYLAERPVERANFLRYATAVWPRLRRAIEEAAGRPANPRRTGKA
jgi:5-methylcytosine-specific restriction endonuclease McrA